MNNEMVLINNQNINIVEYKGERIVTFSMIA